MTLNLPTPGSDVGSWGAKLNAALTALDTEKFPLGVSGQTGIFLNDRTRRPAITIGNAPGSAGFPGQPSSDPRALGALAIYQKFGDETGGTNTPIAHTTQTAYLLANYYGPTLDDSAEAFSTFVGVKNTGTGFTQAKPVTSFEAIAQVEGANRATDYALGVGSRINVTGTARIANGYGFKASVNSSGGPTFGTIDRYVGFFQPVKAAANGGTVTQAYGVYVADSINSETALTLGRTTETAIFSAALDGNTDQAKSLLLIKGPDSASGAATPRGLTALSLQAGLNQTRSILEARDSGGSTRFQVSSAGAVNMLGQQINVANSAGTPQIILNPTSGVTLTDAINVAVGTTTGSQIGTAAAQKLGFYGATPVVRRTLPAAGVVTAADIRQALIDLGLAA